MARVKDNTWTLYQKTDGENTGYDPLFHTLLFKGISF